MELQERGESGNYTLSTQAELLVAVKKNSLEDVISILPSTNPDHFYGAPDFGTCLYIATVKGFPEVASALTAAGADVNGYNPKRKKTPLHAACEEGHPKMVQLLIKHGANTSTLDDKGRTPLHSAANGPLGKKEYTEGHIECLQILLDAGSSINAQDRAGVTALRLAVIGNHKNAVELLISGGANPDADTSCGKTVRTLIQEKMPEVYEKLPPPGVYDLTDEDGDAEKLLFRYEHSRDLSKFQDVLQTATKKGVDVGRIHDGKYTLLQYACENEGLEEFIITLLNTSLVDPNITCPGTTWKPILLAAYQGNTNALRLLVAHKMTDITAIDDIRKETALHKVARMEKVEINNRSYLECLKILTKAIHDIDNHTPSIKRLNVNAVDALGNTALHYAAQNLDGGGRQVGEMVSELLRAGSYVGIQNKMGEPAISRVTPSLIEDYLNDCVGTNGEAPCEEGYELTFDYTMLSPPSTSFNKCTDLTEDGDDLCTVVRETEPLRYICNSKEHQRLLKHPIITSFLFLKWHRIRWIFYGNLAFYSIFVVFLTAYILGMYGTDAPQTESNDSRTMEWTDACFVLIVFLLAVLALRELFQLLMSPKKYIKSLENLLEVLLIILTGIMLFSAFDHKIKQHLAALVILLLWIELVLLVGRHPKLSTYITMFTTVSKKFLTFLSWYSLLIVAFALSFFILFHKGDPTDDSEKKGEEEEKNYFADPGRSVLKTAVMLTGEFEFADLPLDAFQITSHLVFVLFLFLIAVVLLNLLNGLAVSDTQAVQDKAELVGYLSRVALVSHVETMMLGKPLQLLNQLGRCICINRVYHTKLTANSRKYSRNGLGENILVFPELNTIQVLVNRGGKIQPRCCYRNDACKDRCSMDQKIMQAARNIIAKRKQHSEMDEIRLKLNSFDDMLKQMDKKLSCIMTKIMSIEN